MNSAQEYTDRLKTAESELARSAGDKLARSKDLIELVRREILMMETSKSSNETLRAEQRAETYLNQLQEMSER